MSNQPQSSVTFFLSYFILVFDEEINRRLRRKKTRIFTEFSRSMFRGQIDFRTLRNEAVSFAYTCLFFFFFILFQIFKNSEKHSKMLIEVFSTFYIQSVYRNCTELSLRDLKTALLERSLCFVIFHLEVARFQHESLFSRSYNVQTNGPGRVS